MNLLCLLLIWRTAYATNLLEETNPYVEGLKHNHLARNSLHGYVEVRPGAFMFYWFYFADGTKFEAPSKPLIIWIQGGPGFAASGVGNFAELGPLTMDMEPRNHTWVKGRNLLLLDHPVGTGFSYVTNTTLYVKSDREMAIDLSRAIKGFLRRHKEFRITPTYIIGQSYGGRICPRLALYLSTAIKKKKIKMNFKGIGIGGGWVDPKESTLVQADYLYQMGAIDRDLYLTLKDLVKQLLQAVDRKDNETFSLFDDILLVVNSQDNINFNNINTPHPYYALAALNFKMNMYVKPTLGKVNKTLNWEYLALEVYYNLKKNFLTSSSSFLEKLLNDTTLNIVVYNGNLDVVTPLAGASNWVHKLKWDGAAEFSKARRHPIQGVRNGYYKEMKRLSFWSVFGAGHWVPEENPEAMEHVLQHLMSEDE